MDGMTPEKAREVWRAAAERFLSLPRGTKWAEVVRVHAIEAEAWRMLCEAQGREEKQDDAR